MGHIEMLGSPYSAIITSFKDDVTPTDDVTLTVDISICNLSLKLQEHLGSTSETQSANVHRF